MSKEHPTPIDRVQNQVLAYYDKMKAIADFLEKNNAPPELKIQPELEYLQVFIDRNSFKNLMGMWALNETTKIGVYFGLANRQDVKAFGTTCCFVALDAQGKVVPGHFPERLGVAALLQPEDTWIPPASRLTRSTVAGELTLESLRDDVLKQFEK